MYWMGLVTLRCMFLFLLLNYPPATPPAFIRVLNLWLLGDGEGGLFCLAF